MNWVGIMSGRRHEAGSGRTGLCVVIGSKTVSRSKLKGDTDSYRVASSCLGLGRQYKLWEGGAYLWGELAGVREALLPLARQILGFLDALRDFQSCRA